MQARFDGNLSGDHFGIRVALSGETLIVGAHGATGAGGTATIFIRNGTSWTLQTRIGGYGKNVGISGDTAIIGSGASAYIFVRNGTTWTLQATFSGADGFGSSVGISGNTAIVGAYLENVGANTEQGSVSVYTRAANNWTLKTKLLAADGATRDFFGSETAISGNDIAVAAPLKNFDTNDEQGAAYVFKLNFTTRFDFDSDGKADLAVFRPSNGYWYILKSADNSFVAPQFGTNGDQIAPADFDGDGKSDLAVFRDVVAGAGNFAYFYTVDSTTGTFHASQFGSTGDLPVTGDWDGDGKADLAVYRAGTNGGQSNIYYRPTTSITENYRTIPWGAAGDKPLVGDFDGDGKLDPAIYRPSTQQWYILRSSDLQVIATVFGAAGDVPVPADYDGDGLANIAVFRPSTGYWYTSTNPATNYGAVQFGVNDDLPVPADYDGDGKADVAVYRPSNGSWYLLRSTQGFTGVGFGTAGDKPIPNAYIR